MINFNQSCVKLTFKFAPLNSSYMNLTVVSDSDTIQVQPADIVVVSINTKLPGEIVLQLSGKEINDTVVSEDGKILADKHIELIAVEIDRLPISQHFIQKWPRSNNTRTSYFGFNESVVLELYEKNSFYFAIKNHS